MIEDNREYCICVYCREITYIDPDTVETVDKKRSIWADEMDAADEIPIICPECRENVI